MSVRCSAKTNKGNPCKNFVKNGNVCRVHCKSVDSVYGDDDFEQDEVQSPEEIELLFKSFEELADGCDWDDDEYDENDVILEMPDTPPIGCKQWTFKTGFAYVRLDGSVQKINVLKVEKDSLIIQEGFRAKKILKNKIESFVSLL